jgi:hypothetical protein
MLKTVTIEDKAFSVCVDPTRVTFMQIDPKHKVELGSNTVRICETPENTWVPGRFSDGAGNPKIREFVRYLFPASEHTTQREAAWKKLQEIIGNYVTSMSHTFTVTKNGYVANFSGVGASFQISIRARNGQEVDCFKQRGIPNPDNITQAGVATFLNRYGFNSDDFRPEFRKYCKKVQPNGC